MWIAAVVLLLVLRGGGLSTRRSAAPAPPPSGYTGQPVQPGVNSLLSGIGSLAGGIGGALSGSGSAGNAGTTTERATVDELEDAKMLDTLEFASTDDLGGTDATTPQSFGDDLMMPAFGDD